MQISCHPHQQLGPGSKPDFVQRGSASFNSRPVYRQTSQICSAQRSGQHRLYSRGTGTPHVCARCQATTWDSSQAGMSPAAGSFEAKLGTLAKVAANYFPLWLIIACSLGLIHPPALLWFRRDLVTAGLALTMMSMGTTLSVEDFRSLARMPGLVCLGAALQYTIMPLMGLMVSRLAGLPSPFAVGICIVAACPGGVASNVVTFLANADVPLSVAMTTVSTLAAVVATPLITRALVGTLVPVNAAGLLLSTLQVVLIPIATGAWLNHQFPKQVARASPFAPLLAVSMTVLICASIIAVNAAAVSTAGPRLLGGVAALHSGGFLLGYWMSRFLGLAERQCRTNSIEVGMQNSALGAVLASVHFQDPLTPVPCAISACCHSLIGSAVATYFRTRSDAAANQQSTQPA